MAAGLQRSSTSFRRQGSSGLVWDDKFLIVNQTELRNGSLDGKDVNNGLKDEEETEGRPELRPSRSVGSMSMIQRNRFSGSQPRIVSSSYKFTKSSPPRTDPPSPKVRGCGFFGIFGKPVATRTPRSHKARNGITGKKH